MNNTIHEMSILRLPEVVKLTGRCRSSIYQMIADGTFPRSVKLGGTRSIGWFVKDVLAWLYAREKEGHRNAA